MNEPDVPAGHVRALIERPHNEVLEEAARALLAGRDASTIMHAYFGIAAEAGFRLDPTFGAIPIGGGAEFCAPANEAGGESIL